MEFEVFNQSTRVSDRANFPERSPQAPTSPTGGVECEEGPGAATVQHEGFRSLSVPGPWGADCPTRHYSATESSHSVEGFSTSQNLCPDFWSLGHFFLTCHLPCSMTLVLPEVEQACTREICKWYFEFPSV